MAQITGQNNEHARNSLLVRIPEILTSAINQLYKRQHSKEVEEIGKLIYDMKRNREMPLFDNSEDCSIEWNNAIQNLKSKAYFDAPWLFSQCFVFYKLESIVHHLGIDVFANEKSKLLEHSIEDYVPFTSSQSVEAQLFQQLLNSVECSSPIDHLVINDFDKIWTYLQSVNQGSIHIVLNNVGHEFLSDLVLADFLIEHNFASSVVFHVKPYPFFVNNVTLNDVDNAFEHYSQNVKLKDIAMKWTNWRSKFIFKTNPFWNMPFYYSELQVKAPELHLELSNADVVIFKGDYNYRKLSGDDGNSDTAKFNLNISALCIVLRNIKSNTLVGVESTKIKKLTDLDSKWQIHGKYSVLQCFK